MPTKLLGERIKRKEDPRLIQGGGHYVDDVKLDAGGAGLGLSIGKWIAEAHGGTISALSKPGEGSVFQVRIPLAQEDSS
jgi:signal transduction histidine kinase